MKRKGKFPVVFLAVVICGACSDGVETLPKNFIDEAVAEFTNLGFLGAAGHGATRSIKVPDPERPDRFIHPGGVVLREVEASAPLSAAGLETGDVVIRVVEDYLPNKEDPTLDLLTRLESAFTAGKNEIALGYLRGGRVREAALVLDPEMLPPLNQGDLRRIERYALAAGRGLDYLAAVQEEDGSFPVRNPTVDAEMAVASLAGLAFLGGRNLPGGSAYGDSLSKCLDCIGKSLESEKAGHLGSAFALLLLAECVHQDEDLSDMKLLARGSSALMNGRQENGGWLLGALEKEPGYNERTLASHLCLHALGAAERAGVQIGNEPFEKACAFLKANTNDGKVGFVPEPDFDRRSEAGRLAGILAAMRSISCAFSDPYLQKLFKYYSEYTGELAFAPVDESIHLLSAAILSRQKGLPQWNLFNQENQVLLLSLQKSDGSFAALPKSDRKPVPFFEDAGGPAWRTAVYTLIFLLQEDTLPVFSCKTDPSWTRSRDSDGKVVAGGSAEDGPAAGQPEEGQRTMMFTNIDEAIEAMKKMGLDEDSPEMKQLMELKEKMDKKKK